MKLNNFLGAALVTAALGFTFPTAANAEILPSLYSTLATQGIDTTRIQIVEVEGIVIVRGRVADRSEIARTSSVLQQQGFVRVANLLQVSRQPDDERIRLLVERALTDSPALDGCKFRVSTSKGVVTIGGTVREELQKEFVTDITENVDGVKSVVNVLQDRS